MRCFGEGEDDHENGDYRAKVYGDSLLGKAGARCLVFKERLVDEVVGVSAPKTGRRRGFPPRFDWDILTWVWCLSIENIVRVGE